MHPSPASLDLWGLLKAAAHELIENAPTARATVVRDEVAHGERLVLEGLEERSAWDYASVHSWPGGTKLGELGARDLEWEDPATQAYEFRARGGEVIQGEVLLRASTIEHQRLLSTLEDDLFGQERNLKRLEPVLLEASQYLPRLSLRIPFVHPQARLNPEQLEAVRLALSEAPVTLLEGPPGTGKTTVITEIMRQAILAGKRVLCISPTHQAVDNVISRLKREKLPFVPIRIGHESRVQHSDLTEANRADAIRNYLRQERLPNVQLSLMPHHHGGDVLLAEFNEPSKLEALLAILDAHSDFVEGLVMALRARFFPQGVSEARLRLFAQQARDHKAFLEEKLSLARAFASLNDPAIETLGTYLDQRGGSPVFGTAVGFMAARQLMQPKPGQPLPFDLLIVDEASKMTLPQFLLGALRAEKIILVGDSKQLPPFVNAEEQAVLLKQRVPESLVTRSIFQHLELTLLPCYKHSLPRQYRMHRDIVHFSNWAFYGGRLRTGRGDGVNYLQRRTRVTWLDVRDVEDRGGTTSWFNAGEVQQARKLLLEIDRKLAGSPVKKSVGLLSFYKEQKHRLEHMVKGLTLENIETVVGTVDSFQGEEMDIVIISCVRTRSIGFINNAERLNVALTRARDYLFLLGHGQFFKNPEFIISGLFHHPNMSVERHF